MRTLVRLQFAAFSRRKPMLLVAGMFVVATAAIGSFELYTALRFEPGLFETLSFSTRYSVLWPLVLVVLTYEFASSTARRHMEEAVASHPETSHRHWLATAAVPALVLVAAFGVYLALRLSVGAVSSAPVNLLRHVAEAALVDVLAPSIIAMLLGLVLARRNRFAAYAAIVLFVFLIGPYSEILPFALQFATLNTSRIVDIYPAYDLVRLLAPDPTWTVDPLYGFPIEQARWAVAGLWSLVLLGLVLPSLSPRNRLTSIARAACVALATLLLGVALLPSSEIHRDFRPSGTNYSDQIYYELQRDRHPAREATADFEVVRYDLDLRAGRRLEATARLDVTRPTMGGEYRFTLYHGYRLSKVTGDEGRELQFAQTGDYVTVTAGHPQDRLRFEYAGTGGRQVAVHQAVFLPGYFPYYPVPGFVPVWDTQTHSADTTSRGREASVFSIRLRGARHKVVSNLPEGPQGTFEGRTSTPTLVSGLTSQRTVAGHRVIHYPGSGGEITRLGAAISRLRALEKRFGAEQSPLRDGSLIVQIPELVQPNSPAAATSDTVFLSLFDPGVAVDVLLVDAPIRADRANLREAVMYYLNDPEAFVSEAQQIERPTEGSLEQLETVRTSARSGAELMGDYQIPSRNVVMRLFYDRMAADGEDAALSSTYEYLMSEDGESELAFLTREATGVAR